MNISGLIFSATVAIASANIGFASELPAPMGEVILTIEGNIENTNSGKTAEFDRDMLESLGMTQIKTSSPWYNGEMVFEGVLLSALMEYVAADGSNIKAVALNDYGTDIPMSDVKDTGVIIALKLNGSDMEIRDKGPGFIIYPYDSASKFQTQTYYARSAWQVTKMIVE